MDNRLSNSAILKQIIPQALNAIYEPNKKESLCSTRFILPLELIAKVNEEPKVKEIAILQLEKTKEEDKTNKNLIDKLNQIKETSEFDNVITGSKLGLTSYQRPLNGIPLQDLSTDLQNLLIKLLLAVDNPTNTPLYFGKVQFNEITKKLSFYAPDDTELSNILGSVNLSRFSGTVRVDRVLNMESDNAIANSTVAKHFQIIRGLIPEITVQNETLNIIK